MYRVAESREEAVSARESAILPSFEGSCRFKLAHAEARFNFLVRLSVFLSWDDL